MEIKELKVLKEMLQILSIPFCSRVKQSESAVVIAPGEFQNYRLTEGAKLWPVEAKHLWVTGALEEHKYTREQVVKECGSDSPYIVLLERGWNSKEQALAIRDLLVDDFPEVRHVIVATAAYHLPRWILTFLQVMKDRRMILSPAPLLNPKDPSFSARELKSEIEKILTYRAKGDVASARYFKTYLAWRLLQ